MTGHGPSGSRVTLGSNGETTGLVDQRFSSKKALAKALGKPTTELFSAALPLLAGIDAKAADAVFAQLLDEDLSGHPDGSVGAALAYAVSQAWPFLVERVPDEKLLALWRAGRVSAAGLRPSAWARLAPAEVAELVAQNRVAIESIPAEALARLPPDVLLGLWRDGRVDATSLPAGALGSLGAEALEQAFRAGGKALGLAEIARESPALREPSAAAALLNRLAAAAREAPLGEGRAPSRRLSAGQLDLVEALVESGRRRPRPRRRRAAAPFHRGG